MANFPGTQMALVPEAAQLQDSGPDYRTVCLFTSQLHCCTVLHRLECVIVRVRAMLNIAVHEN